MRTDMVVTRDGVRLATDIHLPDGPGPWGAGPWPAILERTPYGRAGDLAAACNARQGFYWWEIDISYYGLKVLSWTGLIWNLKPVPRAAYENTHRISGNPNLAPFHPRRP